MQVAQANDMSWAERTTRLWRPSLERVQRNCEL